MVKARTAIIPLLYILIFMSGCDTSSNTTISNNDTPANITSYGTLIDVRDSQTYKTIVIGTQTWMAENLNYKTDSSWCYDNDPLNCNKYGRLYQWASMMNLDTSFNNKQWAGDTSKTSSHHQGICPIGWHIPTDTEWGELIAYANHDSARITLSADTGWKRCDNDTSKVCKSITSKGYYTGNGSNKYRFNALPAGVRYNGTGDFKYMGYDVTYWTATKCGAGCADARDFYSANGAGIIDQLGIGTGYFDDDYSVRCVKD